MSDTSIKTASKTAESIFTPRELDLLGKALQANKNEVQIDYPKFAELGGFKNANSAKASWHGLKKKLERLHETTADDGEPKGTDAAEENGEETPKTTPASGKKRKAADKGEEAPKTPSSSSKKRKSTAKVDGEEGEETTPAKSAKKPGRKSSAKKAAAATAGADEDEETAAEKGVDNDKDAAAKDSANEDGDLEGDEKGEANKEKDGKDGEAVKEEADEA